MHSLPYTKQRLRAFLAECQRLSDSDFPHSHSRDALDQLQKSFQVKLDAIENLDEGSEPEVVRQHCSLILRDFFAYLPLLGFILRSTNVRNAFEGFGPLLRLARQVLEPNTPEEDRTTRLLISSEWNYSPLTYPRIPSLPGYVFIGFPAPEAGPTGWRHPLRRVGRHAHGGLGRQHRHPRPGHPGLWHAASV